MRYESVGRWKCFWCKTSFLSLRTSEKKYQAENSCLRVICWKLCILRWGIKGYFRSLYQLHRNRAHLHSDRQPNESCLNFSRAKKVEFLWTWCKFLGSASDVHWQIWVLMVNSSDVNLLLYLLCLLLIVNLYLQEQARSGRAHRMKCWTSWGPLSISVCDHLQRAIRPNCVPEYIERMTTEK